MSSMSAQRTSQPKVLEGVAELVDRAAVELPGGNEILAGRMMVWKIRCCAEWPDAVASAAVPPSSAAIFSSSTAWVGFMMRV